MRNIERSIPWVTIPDWHTARLVGLSKATGLIRARMRGETMFLGHAAKSGIGPRLAAYRSPRGTGQRHYAGQMIYKHRAEIRMQIAAIDGPAEAILQMLAAMLDEHNPPWNVPNGHHRSV